MTKIERGSDWRKWDLHFHTPSSYDYGYSKLITNQETSILYRQIKFLWLQLQTIIK